MCFCEKAGSIFAKSRYKIIMKRFLTFFVVVFFVLAAFSQAFIQFENKVHDFGQIQEVDGKVTHEFVFKNTGNAPLVISQVRVSCGCTTPKWTKTPIEPGKTGSITATYNPIGRKGAFSSSITIISNAAENQERLTLRGNIIPKDREGFHESIETLRLKTKAVRIGNVNKNTSQQRTISVKNDGDLPLQLLFGNVPTYLTVTAIPETLQPNQEGEISVTFNSSLCNQWGEIVSDIYVSFNDKKTYTEENRIRVTAIVVEDFNELSLEEKRRAPIMELNTRVIDFGTLKPNTKTNTKLSIKNSGTSTLKIRHIANSNKEININSNELSINSGKKANVKVELNTNGLQEGYYRKNITLQTNDYQNTFVVVELLWRIKK